MTDTPESVGRERPCPTCCGEGSFIVSHEMAMDAGDRTMEGVAWGCSTCNGSGFVECEPEPGAAPTEVSGE
jgi:hypothetical protein